MHEFYADRGCGYLKINDLCSTDCRDESKKLTKDKNNAMLGNYRYFQEWNRSQFKQSSTGLQPSLAMDLSPGFDRIKKGEYQSLSS